MFPKMLRLLEAGNSLEGGAGRNSPEGGTRVGGRREPGGTRRPRGRPEKPGGS